MKNDEIVIYTDGACSGNPGPGGWGAIVVFDNQVQELGGASCLATTNNRMEITSIIESLKWINSSQLKYPLCIYTDSQYVINAMTKWLPGWVRNNWKTAAGEPVKNQDLFEELHRCLKPFIYRFQYIPGHSGFWGNERADQIAVDFSKYQMVDLYSGSWTDYQFSTESVTANISLDFVKVPKSKTSTQKVGYVVWDYQKLLFFTDWSACAKVTQGRAGIKYKKIKNKEEFRAFVAQYGCPESEAIKIEQVFK